jgi:hypothetical protein
MVLVRLLAICLCILGFAEAAEAGCTLQDITYCDGCTLDQQMAITQFDACRIYPVFPNGIISSKTLVKPKHGAFGHSNASDFAYQVQKGYVGEDYFEYEFVYREQTGAKSRVVVRTHVISQ